MTTESIEQPATRATLYRKIAAVTAAVSRIPKNGENTFHHYKYATESDITDGLRELLKENGLAFLPPSVVSWERDETADNPKQGPRTRVQVQFGIACCDTGEVFTSMLWGEGQDTSDKGFYKAYTGAVKYFLMKTFLIATGDDPEQRDEQQQRQLAQQQSTQRQAPQQRPPARQTPAQGANGELVRGHQQTNGSGNSTPPQNAAEAERRFFARYGEIVGGENWAAVQRYLGSRTPKPTTFEGWIAAADAVRGAGSGQKEKRQLTQQELIDALKTLWVEERRLGGETPAAEVATDLDEASREQLIDLGKKARARVLALQKQGGMPEVGLPASQPTTNAA